MARRPPGRNGRVAMNFVSFEFAAFLVAVYVLHWSCRYAGTRKWLLTIASYVFYALIRAWSVRLSVQGASTGYRQSRAAVNPLFLPHAGREDRGARSRRRQL